MSAAWALGKTGEHDVELWERAPEPGGVATSRAVDGTWINDGVQAATPSYANVLALHRLLGFEPTPVDVKIAFGRGRWAWNNQFPTDLVRAHAPEIRRFGELLELVQRFEPLFVAIPIDGLLRLLGYSATFRHRMVFPLVALFFGTGDQTPRVSSAVVARVFLDDRQRLFDYDPQFLLQQKPRMAVFPALAEVYGRLVDAIAGRVFLGRAVARLDRRSDFVEAHDDEGGRARFDDVVLACDAATALRLLARPTRRERWVLGNVRYYRDVTVTHSDVDYMRQHYDFEPGRGDQYLVRNDERDPRSIEMSFHLNAYQPQLADHERAVFQTIFLDEDRAERWSRAGIDPDRVLLERRWTQFAHTWRHFALTVPFIRFLQGRQRTWYAGAYTLMNTHELAVCSGLAAAYRLGAGYPLSDDRRARASFELYLRVAHGSRWVAGGLGTSLDLDASPRYDEAWRPPNPKRRESRGSTSSASPSPSARS